MPREDVGTAFVYCFLVRNKDRIADAGSGATFPEVPGKTMAGIELTLPDIDLRTEFKEWATPLLEQRSWLEEENRQLGNLRDALLPKPAPVLSFECLGWGTSETRFHLSSCPARLMCRMLSCPSKQVQGPAANSPR